MSELDVAARARQLHQQGLGIRDISILLNAHEAQVARWIASTDHDEAAELHRAAWQERGDA